MKYLFILIYSFIICPLPVFPQEITVPEHMKCAGMELHFTESLRQELQSEVNTLIQSQKYFNVKLERAQQYFPIIERIFKEEHVPEDIKFLAMQESALIPDAVSTSNAVGFWQFKEVTAKEMGLRVNQHVDDRMNIVTATRGAAKYLKTNNLYFNNWIYSILAYNTGRGGSEQYVQNKYYGATKMVLDKSAHWYVKKFLSHMIAFGNKLNGYSSNSSTSLTEYIDGGGKSLNQIANEFHVSPDEMVLYNKWLKSGRIPDDGIYYVIIPQEDQHASITVSDVAINSSDNPSPNMFKYPVINENNKGTSRVIKINGIPGIIGNSGDVIRELAALGGVQISQFLLNNDISIEHKIIKGQVYYFRPKHSKAREYYHTVLPGESLWSISQKYGLKIKALESKNRLKGQKSISQGMVLWIRYIRPDNEEIRYVHVPAFEDSRAKSELIDTEDNQIEDSQINEKDEKLKLIQGSMDNPGPIDSTMNLSNEHPQPSLETDTLTSTVKLYPEADSVAENHPLFHVVESGETLYGISKKYNIPINQLMEMNDLNFNDNIKIGQQIFLKEPATDTELGVKKNETVPETYILYEVQKGDTMYGISKKYNVTVEEIMLWNNRDNVQMKIGENLKIYKRTK